MSTKSIPTSNIIEDNSYLLNNPQNKSININNLNKLLNTNINIINNIGNTNIDKNHTNLNIINNTFQANLTTKEGEIKTENNVDMANAINKFLENINTNIKNPQM